MAYFKKNYNFRGKTQEERIAKKIIKAYLSSPGGTILPRKDDEDFKVISE